MKNKTLKWHQKNIGKVARFKLNTCYNDNQTITPKMIIQKIVENKYTHDISYICVWFDKDGKNICKGSFAPSSLIVYDSKNEKKDNKNKTETKIEDKTNIVNINIDEIKELLPEALTTDGEHHKQWYLEQIANLIDIDIVNQAKVDMEEYYKNGIAP
jgi:uncharacterized protein YodC (DUF2158 family)